MANNGTGKYGLRVEGLDAGYGAVRVLDKVSIHVEDGETVTLLGTGRDTRRRLGCVGAREDGRHAL